MPMTASSIGGSRGEPLRSASAIVATTESGQHLLRIDGYSGTKAVPTGSHIKSRSFLVGGHSWHICYYPNGLNSTCSDYISIFLRLDHSVPQGVRAQFTFSLLDHGGKPVPHFTFSAEYTFRDQGFGCLTFIKRDALEKSEHLKDDRFMIRCDFTVVTSKGIQTMDIAIPQQPPVDAVVVVPPSDLHRHLGGLLATGEAADVTFQVDTRTFAAHRCVLMARSPVFHAELSAGSSSSLTTTTANNGAGAAVVAVVQIEDMEAQDFEAFLHYMYTDSLPPEMTKEGSEAAATMRPDLVAAANRYKMERLRLVCEDRLSKFVNVTTVALILAFAVEHHCLGLKEVCLKFLEDPANLREVIKTDGLEHLSKTCPSVLKDMIAKLAAAQ